MALTGHVQDLILDQTRKHVIAGRRIEGPQPTRLREGQTQARHLAVFTTHT